LIVGNGQLRSQQPEADKIAGRDDQGGIDEQLFVGEAQLIAEKERKRHVHTDDAKHGYHLQIFAYQARCAHHVLDVGKIDTARQLKQAGE